MLGMGEDEMLLCLHRYQKM